MSLALVEDYSSEIDNREADDVSSSSSGSIDSHSAPHNGLEAEPEAEADSFFSEPPLEPTSNSSLPSPALIFSKITGRPDFLTNTPTENAPYAFIGRSKPPAVASQLEEENTFKERKVRTGAVVQAKPQLIPSEDRGANSIQENVKQKPGAVMPPPEDAAKLLGTCLQCGVPKTYSGLKESMVCPLCHDSPRNEGEAELDKKRSSKVKDKEKSKRMKGQSSHATWKSETEMHLRQQFD